MSVSLRPGEIASDLFCGGGGFSLGYQWATGQSPDIGLNHDKHAIFMHACNHPDTEHYREGVFELDPIRAARGKPVGWLHLSPDCCHFSRAKGGKPVDQGIRGLADVAITWAEKVAPRIISLENVWEFTSWGGGSQPQEPAPPDADSVPGSAVVTGGSMSTVAALFVVTDGVYFHAPFCDPWDIRKNAISYSGPYPVVAHPPCERWGRYWSGGPNADPSKPGFQPRKKKGDDGGCFASALESVRRWGGVLEHPEASHAWSHFGIAKPPRGGGWIPTSGGWTCCVEQGHYGHPARKATWLYACRTSLPELKWGPCSPRERLEQGFHSAEERRRWKAAHSNAEPHKRIGVAARAATPLEFRDLLLGIARTAVAA